MGPRDGQRPHTDRRDSAIDHNADTAETRRIAHGAVQSILVDGDTSALDDHLAGKRTCSETRASPTA